MADGNILYLSFKRFEDGKALRGGALVVDSTTEPLEFRCTTAVRPTKLQRILWGARLGDHLAADLLGLPLVKALAQPFHLVVVRQPDFLGMRESIDIPLVRLRRDLDAELEDEGPSTEGKQTEDDDAASGSSDGILTNALGRFEPVIIECRRGRESDMSAARAALAPLFVSRDVLEPFERVETALEAIHVQESKGASG